LPRLSAALADRYRIERELGRGGIATVFLAEDLKCRTHRAIKVLDPASDPRWDDLVKRIGLSDREPLGRRET